MVRQIGQYLHRAALAQTLETSHPPTYYLPPDDCALECFEPASGTSLCEWKGMAGYFDVVAGDRIARRAASITASAGSSGPTLGLMDDGGIVYLESGFSRETINALKLRGHQISLTAGGFGGYQAIWRDPDTGVYAGASESRKDGQAIDPDFGGRARIVGPWSGPGPTTRGDHR